MKRVVFLVSLFFFAGSSIAKPPLDSLRILLQNHKTEDSTRISLLLKYGKSLFFTNSDSMMYYADEGLRISEKIKWLTGIADAYQLKGVSYSYVLSQPVKALDCYHKALEIDEQLGRKQFQWQTMANIALIHYNQEEYPEALTFYRKAKSVLDSMKNKSGEGRLLMNIGHVYFELKDTTSAINYYKQSLAISQKNGDSLVAANVLNSMGYIFLRKQNYPDAKKFISDGLAMARATNNNVTRASALVNMALFNLETKNFEEAEKYAKEGLELSKAVGNVQFQRQAWEALQQVYEKTGRYQESLSAYKNFILLNDSLINSEKKKEIARKEMQFQFDKKQALDQVEIKRQRMIKNILIGGSAFLILIAISGIILYKKKRDAQEEKTEAEFKTLVSETEMKALRSQMNPHFIFNSLGAISDFMIKNNAQLADEYLGKFATLMRMVLENSEQKEIPLEEDIKALELYMELEALRASHRFTFEIKTDGDIDLQNTLVPPLLMQPFVENSIRHGLSEKEAGGKIIIHFAKHDDMLICNIEDNGIGLEKAGEIKNLLPKKNKKSLGIKITQSRIKILNQTKKKQVASMRIRDLGKGTNVEIKLPLVLNF